MTEEYVRVFTGRYGSYNDFPRGNNDNVLAGLSYFTWIVALVSLVAIKPLSPYLRFHAVQALGLTLTLMVVNMVTVMLCFVLIGFILLPFVWALSFYPFVIMIIVLTGKDHRVPYLADYVESHFV